MFAWWAPCVTFTASKAPPALFAWALLAALNDGLKASAPQLVTWKGLDSGRVAAKVDVSVESVVSAPQFVGFSRKLGRLTATLRFLSRNGTPLTIVGRLLVAITRPLYGSTLIAARVTTVPRLKGPATAGTGTDRPYGAPLYGPVMNTGP